MPPNAEPGSSPASARKNVPSRSRYTRTTRSPHASKAEGATSAGTRAAVATVAENTTNGAGRKSQEALRETTTSL
jgi:hypothetical protein